jgi:myo-inositol-1(or 4)-monophosphatase
MSTDTDFLIRISPVLETLVRQTGTWIQTEGEKFHSGLIEYKGKNDLVSYVDVTAEKKLVEGCLAIIPGSGFLNEEGGEIPGTNSYRWIIDPLDGTTNFMHGIPAYCISIALQFEEKTVLGMVLDIMRGELFSAIKGQGATANGRPVTVSKAPELGQCLLATGFPYTTFDMVNDYLAVLKAFMEASHGIRRVGSAALDLAWVACGRFDGFFEYGLKPWDVAAGGLIVQEAGGTVSDFLGSDNFVFGRQIVASNARVHESMLRIIGRPA